MARDTFQNCILLTSMFALKVSNVSIEYDLKIAIQNS